MNAQRWLTIALSSVFLCTASGQASMAHGQSISTEPEKQTPAIGAGQSIAPGRNAQSAVGVVGERQGTEETKAIAKPMARLDTRVRNRIENRLQNRVDRSYRNDPDAGSQVRDAELRARRASPRT